MNSKQKLCRINFAKSKKFDPDFCKVACTRKQILKCDFLEDRIVAEANYKEDELRNPAEMKPLHPDNV